MLHVRAVEGAYARRTAVRSAAARLIEAPAARHIEHRELQ